MKSCGELEQLNKLEVIQFYFYNSKFQTDVEKYTLHIIYLKDNNTVWTAIFVTYTTDHCWSLVKVSSKTGQNFIIKLKTGTTITDHQFCSVWLETGIYY